MEQIKRDMEVLKIEDYNVALSEILKVLGEKVEKALEMVNEKEFQLSVCMSAARNQFNAWCIQPIELIEMAEELDDIEAYGNFMDSSYDYSIDLTLKDLIYLGLTEIKDMVDDMISKYKNSIFYIYGESKNNKHLPIKLKVEGDIATLNIGKDIELTFDAMESYRVKTMPAEAIEKFFEDRKYIVEGIAYKINGGDLIQIEGETDIPFIKLSEIIILRSLQKKMVEMHLLQPYQDSMKGANVFLMAGH
jgi:hypothetical protein